MLPPTTPAVACALSGAPTSLFPVCDCPKRREAPRSSGRRHRWTGRRGRAGRGCPRTRSRSAPTRTVSRGRRARFERDAPRLCTEKRWRCRWRARRSSEIESLASGGTRPCVEQCPRRRRKEVGDEGASGLPRAGSVRRSNGDDGCRRWAASSDDPETVERFTLTTAGTEVASLMELDGIVSGIDPSALELGGGTIKLSAKRVPPTVTLNARHDQQHGPVVVAQDAALSGAQGGRRDADLVMYATDGTEVARLPPRARVAVQGRDQRAQGGFVRGHAGNRHDRVRAHPARQRLTKREERRLAAPLFRSSTGVSSGCSAGSSGGTVTFSARHVGRRMKVMSTSSPPPRRVVTLRPTRIVEPGSSSGRARSRRADPRCSAGSRGAAAGRPSPGRSPSRPAAPSPRR